MKVSVISATFNRAQLLDNALAAYANQTLPFEDWEYLIADDGSQDRTRDVVEKWRAKGLPLRYFDAAADLGLPKEPGKWRDGCRVRNAVSTWACGEVLVATHPEIMVPPNALEVMHDTVRAHPTAWVTAIPYWLPEGKMAPWKRDLFNLRKTEGFYDPTWPNPVHSPGAPDYRNQNQETRHDWESEVFWAMEMGLWRWLGGFREFEVWGSVDMDFHARRRCAAIPTVIARDPLDRVPSGNLMVFHQWHGDSPRDMDAAMAAMQGQDYSTVERMRAQGGLHAVYHHGHRERAADGNLAGILDDHQERYRWANLYCAGQRVLDVPCGTGYGAILVGNAKRYTGVDIDEESISYANVHYYKDTPDLPRLFKVGSMLDLPIDDGTIDQILCFEGLEHVEDQALAIEEFYRVLREGGRFIVSTPQKGAASGTPWDRHMLSREELQALFPPEKWQRLDWFYQESYGSSPVRRGAPRPADQIMILGGTAVK
jgi:SAM-dependent methyltransferase